MDELIEAKEGEEANIGEWASSSMSGKWRDAEICCNEMSPSCEHFPKCGDCQKFLLLTSL